MQLLSPKGETAVGFNNTADGTVPSFNILDLNKTIRASIVASDPSTGSPFEIVRIAGPDNITRAQMSSGFTASTNGLVQTFDAAGVQNGLLGVP